MQNFKFTGDGDCRSLVKVGLITSDTFFKLTKILEVLLTRVQLTNDRVDTVQKC